MSGKYLLLRDNKQSGPYSLDDIKTMGLKKYDLVWVEGKSAAWRYPCEVDEFKSFAPQVDEQPYDRFYKKPAQQEHYQLQQGTTQKISQEDKPLELKSSGTLPEQKKEVNKKEEVRKIPPRKYVSISLPGSIRVKIDPEKKKDTQAVVPVSRQEVPRAQDQEKPKPKLEPIFAIQETKLPQVPVAEPAQVSSPVQRQFTGSDYMQYTAFGLGILTIVMVLFLVYNSITDPLVATPPVKVEVAKPKATTPIVEPIAGQIPNAVPSESHQQEIKPDPQPAVTQPEKNTVHEPMSTLPVKKTTVVRFNADQPNPANTDAKSPVVLSLASKVTVSLNKYKVNMFGGIDDIKVNLQNSSDYKLDLVVVEIRYIANNNKVVKTETVRFKDLDAGASAELNAPKSTRGIKVSSKISYITSSAAGISENL